MLKDLDSSLLGDSATAVNVANLHIYCAIYVRCQRHPLPVTVLPSATNAIALRYFLLLAMSRCSCSGDSLAESRQQGGGR